MESRKRKRWLIALTVGVFAFGIWFFFLRNTEPSYEGKRLSEWLVQYGQPSWGDSEKAKEAIQAIGTNGLPILVSWIAYDPGSWRRKLWMTTYAPGTQRPRLWTVANKYQGLIQRSPTLRQLVFGGVERAFASQQAFEALGPMAAPAIPWLHELASRSGNSDASRRAVNALVYIGPTAIPALTNLVATTGLAGDILHRNSLEHFGAQAAEFAPFLIEQVRHGELRLASVSADSLGALRLDPVQAIPALIEATSSPDTKVRRAAVHALSEFEAEAISAIPALQRLRSDSNVTVRADAARAIEKIKGKPPE
ncbi:hypothetical protein GC207_14985 [bacterium]|nr:hypothetical protein [bacterium]